MNGGWKALDSAPHDREVWLFLPSAEFTRNEQGHVNSVVHHVVAGKWDGRWVNRIGNPVYPSLWHDGDVRGAVPQHPELT